MTFEDIFPNYKKVLRNAICVGLIVLASSGIAKFPPTLETIYGAVIGAVIAGIVEFTNAYYKKPAANSKKNAIKTFFF